MAFVLQKTFPGVRALSETNKKDPSSLNCQSFLNYVLTLKSYFKKQTALKQSLCSKGVKNLFVLAGGNTKKSFQAGISKAY